MEKVRKPLASEVVIPDNVVENIFQEGCLLWISSRAWGNRKKVPSDLLDEDKLPSDVVKAVQNLVDRKAVSEVTFWIRAAMNKARDSAMPWFNDGVHFVRKHQVEELDAYFTTCRENLRAELEKFLQEYESLKADFKEKNPQLYKEENYPSVQSLRERFSLRWGFRLITLPSDGKVKVLSKDKLLEEDRKFKQQMRETVEESVVMVRSAFVELVNHLHSCLSGGKKFHSTTVEKPKQFLEEFFKNFNIFGDESFVKIAADCREILDGVYSEDLKNDEEYRKVIGKAIGSVVKDLKKLPVVKVERDLDLDF
jgi:hypothetical protein